MKFLQTSLFAMGISCWVAAPAFSQQALGVNYNQFLTSIQEQQLNRLDATWLRGFLDMHQLGDQDPSRDPNIQAILEAKARGHKTVLNLKWNYHKLPFPKSGRRGNDSRACPFEPIASRRYG